jgi:hypothetical protein
MYRLAGTLCFLLCAVVVSAQEGKLWKVREEVGRAREDGPDDHNPRRRGDHCGCDDDDGILGAILGDLIAGIFWAPGSDTECEKYVEVAFPAHPYPEGHPGHLWLGRTAQEEGMHEPESLKWYSVRVQVENGNDFDGLNRFAGRLTIDTASRFGIHTHWDWFHEDLGGGRSDQLVFSSTNLTYRFAQHEMFEFYGGCGVRTMNGRAETAAGFNGILGFDAFLVEPLVFSGSFEAGWLEQATVYRLRAGLGVVWDHAEAFAGYDYLSIGAADLHGPMVGLRLWW